MTAHVVQLPVASKPAKQVFHITDALAKRLPAPPAGNKVFYDDATPGFGVRVTAAGARSYVFGYQTKSGRKRMLTIGAIDNWRAVAAREEARAHKRIVQQGGDPQGDLAAMRDAPTINELIDRFLAEHVSRKRPTTAATYKLMLDLHVRPALGAMKVEAVTFADCDGLHRKVTNGGSPYVANRVVAVLSKMFNLSHRWGMRADNPAKGIERNAEVKRKRYLSGEELTRLTAALASHADKQTADIVRLLLLTGARRGEVLSCRWADLDLDGSVWIKPGSTTKQRTDHVTPLSSETVELLSGIRAAQLKAKLGEFVFPGPGGTRHQVDIKKGWASLCKVAKISGLRTHDLRHSFASFLVSSGASLPLIGALLGHSNPTTTARYTHLFDDPLRAAVKKVGGIIGAAGKKGQ
jgi:integrase